MNHFSRLSRLGDHRQYFSHAKYQLKFSFRNLFLAILLFAFLLSLFVSWSVNAKLVRQLESYGANPFSASDRFDMTQFGPNPNPSRGILGGTKIFSVENHVRYKLRVQVFNGITGRTSTEEFELEFPQYGITFPHGSKITASSLNSVNAHRIEIEKPPGTFDYWTPGSASRTIDDEYILLMFFDYSKYPNELNETSLGISIAVAKKLCRDYAFSMVSFTLVPK